MPELLSNPEHDWVLLTPASGRGDAGVQVTLPSAESTGKGSGEGWAGMQGLTSSHWKGTGSEWLSPGLGKGELSHPPPPPSALDFSPFLTMTKGEGVGSEISCGKGQESVARFSRTCSQMTFDRVWPPHTHRHPHQPAPHHSPDQNTNWGP